MLKLIQAVVGRSHTTLWRGLLTAICFCLYLTGASPELHAAGLAWKAGTARAVMTPQKPLWMAGYAGRTEPAADKQHDLYIRVLALEDASGRRGIVVATDSLGIPKLVYETVCQAMHKRHGLERSQIMLHASHTHCGPVLEGSLHDAYGVTDQQRLDIQEYTTWLTAEIVKTMNAALESLRPATLSCGTGMADFAVNRRTNREPDVPVLREQNLLMGPVDHTVPTLAVRGADGKLIAIVFTYACHNTTLSFQKWCGDYAGFAELNLEQQHPGAVALFCMGCGADQNPLPRRTVELCEQYGQKLSSAVESVLNQPMLNVESNLEMRHAFVSINMDPPRSTAELEKLAASQPTTYIQRWAARLLDEARSGVQHPTSYEYPIQAWRLGGQQLWITLGGEVVVDYALRLKAELGDQTWISAYTNDVMAYIPSKRVLLEGGYEGQSSMMVYGLPSERWSPDIEERIVGGVIELVKSLDR